MHSVFFIEKLIGENWHRWDGPFGLYHRAFECYDKLSPKKLFRIVRYESVEIIKIEEE